MKRPKVTVVVSEIEHMDVEVSLCTILDGKSKYGDILLAEHVFLDLWKPIFAAMKVREL